VREEVPAETASLRCCSRTACPYDTPCLDAPQPLLEALPIPIMVMCVRESAVVWANPSAKQPASPTTVVTSASASPSPSAPEVAASTAAALSAKEHAWATEQLARLLESSSDVSQSGAVTSDGLTMVEIDTHIPRRQVALIRTSTPGGVDQQRVRALSDVMSSIAQQIAWVMPEVLVAPGIAFHALPGADTLTDRERRTIMRIGRGGSIEDIAEELYVSESTVRNYLSSIYRKLGVSSRTELMELLLASTLGADQTADGG